MNTMRKLFRELRCLHPIVWVFVTGCLLVAGTEAFVALHFIQKFW